MILYDTVDVRGRDCWRSIFCQIRKDAPDGEIATEKQLTTPEPAGDLARYRSES